MKQAFEQGPSSEHHHSLNALFAPLIHSKDWTFETQDIVKLKLTEAVINFIFPHFQFNEVIWAENTKLVLTQELKNYQYRIVVPPFSLKANGMTATNSFSDCYPEGVRVEKDPAIGLPEALLLRPHNNQVEILTQYDKPSIFQKLASKMKEGIDGFLDGANYIPEPSETIIREFEALLKAEGHSVPEFWVFVSTDNHIVMKKSGSEAITAFDRTEIQNQSVFYWLKQKDGRGVDLPMTQLVVSVTIKNPEEIKQDDGRNRASSTFEETYVAGMPTDQTPRTIWWISDALVPSIEKKLSLKPHTPIQKTHVKTWLEIIASERDKDLYVKGFTTQIDHVIYERALQILTHPKSSNADKKVALKFFIKETPTTPFERSLSLQTDMAPQIYFEELERSLKSQYGPILTRSDQKAIKDLCQKAALFKGFEDKIAFPLPSLDQAVEVEVATQTDVQAQVTQQQQSEETKDLYIEKAWDLTPAVTSIQPKGFLSLSQYLEKAVQLPIDLKVSKSFLITHNSQLTITYPSTVAKRIEWILVYNSEIESDKPPILALTLMEADNIRELIKTSPIAVSLYHCGELRTPILTSTSAPDTLPELLQHKIRETVLFLNQDLNALTSGITYLKTSNPAALESLMTKLQKAHFKVSEHKEIARVRTLITV